MRRHFDPVTLQLFVTVCEERNIARAAAREAMVASAVSKRITAIERDIGVALLVRGRRGIEPTSAGEVLLRQAREVLATMGRMHADLAEFASGVHGSVRVLASLSVLAEFLPDDIGRFLARHRSVRVSMEERVSPEIVRGVREGAADCGVLWDAGDLRGLVAHPYREDHLVVVVHPEHALARRARLRFAEVLEHEVVGVLPGSIMDTKLQQYAAIAGKALVQRVRVSTIDAACRIVAANLGIAVVPREAAQPHVKAQRLRMIPLQDAWARRRFVVCVRPDEPLTASAAGLIKHLCAAATAKA